MSKRLSKQLKALGVGDLICAEWYDASTGKARTTGMAIDVPVKSWGVYLGILGEKSRHLVLAQNVIKFSVGVYDVDYTAVPLSWATHVTVVGPGCVDPVIAKQLLESFASGRLAGVAIGRNELRHGRMHMFQEHRGHA